MTPKEKREWDNKVQLALADMKVFIDKHKCLPLFSIDATAFVLSFNTNPQAIEQALNVLEARWKVIVCSGNQLPIYEASSPELQKYIGLQKKVSKLMTIIPPEEYLDLMSRINAGENVEQVLAEYDGQIIEHEAKMKAAEDNPQTLLADFSDLNGPEDKIPPGLNGI